MPKTARGLFAVVLLLSAPGASSADEQKPVNSWPPKLNGAKRGTVVVRHSSFLKVPAAVEKVRTAKRAATFVMAKSPPTVRLAFHSKLGRDAIGRRLWSSWGDIALASDGSVYCGIGDHGNAVGGDARCFVYRWDAKRKTLTQVVDMNKVIPPGNGQPAWSKIHAKIDEARDGRILFCCTLNDGNRAKRLEYKWNKKLPGGQIYAYDPKTGRTEVFADLPPKRCTATSRFDRQRNIWWCNLEAGGGNALWGLNLSTKRIVQKSGRDGRLQSQLRPAGRRLDPA